MDHLLVHLQVPLHTNSTMHLCYSLHYSENSHTVSFLQLCPNAYKLSQSVYNIKPVLHFVFTHTSWPRALRMLSKYTTTKQYPTSDVYKANIVPIAIARILTLGRWAIAVGHSDSGIQEVPTVFIKWAKIRENLLHLRGAPSQLQ